MRCGGGPVGCLAKALDLPQHVVSSYGVPDDVRFSIAYRIAVTKDGAAVGSPRHLEHAGRAANALDPKTCPESFSTLQVGDELVYRSAEFTLLVGTQVGV